MREICRGITRFYAFFTRFWVDWRNEGVVFSHHAGDFSDGHRPSVRQLGGPMSCHFPEQ